MKISKPLCVNNYRRIFRLSGLLLILLTFSACDGYRPVLEQKPIVFDQKRKELTKEYLKTRYNLPTESVQIEPRMIVLHWTAIPTLEKSFQAFYSSTLPNHRSLIKGAGQLNVSAHFLVDRDGKIYQLLPETTMARHVIGLNHCAIGIENVGGEEQPLTKEQLKANVWLVKELKSRYAIDYVIGHHEYTLFEEHPLWLEVDKGYRTQKTDPGDDFMRRVRSATSKLGFKPLPVIENIYQNQHP